MPTAAESAKYQKASATLLMIHGEGNFRFLIYSQNDDFQIAGLFLYTIEYLIRIGGSFSTQVKT